ncbi:MAG: hypothetical protein KDA49_04565 [Rhodospirillaceae bacterium]|nr:hypothetical protein [Rhodospirillaceae bacterium]
MDDIRVSESGRFSGLDNFGLATLIDPMTPETFLKDYFEQQVLVVNRNQPDHFANLLSFEDIDWVLTTLHLTTSDINMTDARRKMSADEYAFESGLVDAAKVAALFADGATIIMPHLHMRLPKLSDACRAMEREFGYRFQTNIYLTPPGEAQGFHPHYDNHDVFVLQVSGSKSWKIYDTPVELPHRGQAFNPEAYKLGPVSQEFVLKAGDLTYIPRGVVHDAVSTDEASLHITLGVLSKTWTDLLVEAVTLASMRDPALRRSLPYGLLQGAYDRPAARETYKALLARCAELVDADEMMEQMADDIVSTRHGLLWGQLSQVARLGELTLDSTVGPRPNLICRTVEKGDCLFLEAYGQVVEFPAHVRPAMDYALNHTRFAVRDLPDDLDDEGKMVLVRRLIREGLLRSL